MTNKNTQVCVDDSVVSDLGVAKERWVLWHVTGRCNIECPYCYGSFEGGSYKADYSPSDDVPINALKKAADDLAKIGYNRVHVNGGEPLLRNDILDLLQHLKMRELRVWLLTNGTTRIGKLNAILERGLVELIAISVDAKESATINRQRERGQVVLKHLVKIVSLRKKLNPNIKIGVYCVATKFNVRKIPGLIDYLIDLGVDYFNVQPMYLPPEHPFRPAILTAEDASLVEQYIEHLNSKKDQISVPTDANLAISKLALQTDPTKLSAKGCFAQDGRYLFIGPRGDVYGCPSIPSSDNVSLGNICEHGLENMVAAARSNSRHQCSHLSMDCLGMYEMAYRDD